MTFDPCTFELSVVLCFNAERAAADDYSGGAATAAGMSVTTQLGLLLWKNFTYRRRQTVSHTHAHTSGLSLSTFTSLFIHQGVIWSIKSLFKGFCFSVSALFSQSLGP